MLKSPIAEDVIAPDAAPRTGAILRELTGGDTSLAMAHLAQLHRQLTGEEPAADITLIYDDVREQLTGACYGPDHEGGCPQAEGGRVSCSGAWLLNAGWMFKAADDAEVCPLAVLGLAQLPPRAPRVIPEAGTAAA